MKSLNTLVQDIYALLQSGKAKIDAVRLADIISRRLENSKSGEVLRMSALGERCWRKLWYRQHLPDKAEPLAGNTLLTFLMGDIAEEVVLSLAEQAEGHRVTGRQDTLELDGVLGHRDAIIDGVLVDVKSANSRSIEKFKGHNLEKDDPFGYLEQLGAYLEASKDDDKVEVKGEAAFLAFDKELGHLVVDRYKPEKRDWKKWISELRGMLSSSEPPRRAYMAEPDGKSGNMKLPLECRYCQYKNECWKNANGGKGLRKFLYSNGPRWLTHVEREPDVQEVRQEVRPLVGEDTPEEDTQR